MMNSKEKSGKSKEGDLESQKKGKVIKFWMDRRCIYAVSAQHLGRHAVSPVDLGHRPMWNLGGPSVHDALQRGHPDHLYLDVRCGNQWTDLRGRGVLHDLPLPRAGVWRGYRAHVHSGQLHRCGHVHYWFRRA